MDERGGSAQPGSWPSPGGSPWPSETGAARRPDRSDWPTTEDGGRRDASAGGGGWAAAGGTGRSGAWAERAGWGAPGRVRRQRWPVRVLAGLILVAAALLLWPFADWSWWPVVIGLGVLVLLTLLRLDRLLFGWAPHLAGLVTVVLMAARSDPWAWGLAAGLAVLGIGFTRLPRPRVLVAGAVLVTVFGTGYAVVHYRDAAQPRAQRRATEHQYLQSRAALPADQVVAAVAQAVATDDRPVACALLGDPGAGQFAGSVGAPDCPTAVGMLRARVTDPGHYPDLRLPEGALTRRPDGTATAVGCRARWPDGTTPPGPPLGTFQLRLLPGSTYQYVITGYTPCR